MAKHPKLKPLTEDERHARFKELAREVEAEGTSPDYERTVRRLAEQLRGDGKKPD